ncbi:hypothetical protein ACKWTF_010810 [Chironomus riparius]
MSSASVLDIAWTASSILKMFGYATFSLKKNNNKEIIVTYKDILLFVINLSMGFYMTYRASIYIPDYVTEKTLMTYVGKFTMVSGGIICIISMICCFAFRNKVWKLINLIQGIDIKFHQANINTEFKQAKKVYGGYFIILMLFIAVGAFIMLFQFNYYKKPIVAVHFVYLITSFCFCMLWMKLFHVALYRRFKIMNNVLL